MCDIPTSKPPTNSFTHPHSLFLLRLYKSHLQNLNHDRRPGYESCLRAMVGGGRGETHTSKTARLSKSSVGGYTATTKTKIIMTTTI